MNGINVGRWLGGGVAAGAVIWLLEGAASFLYMDDMQEALAAHSLAMEMTGGTMALIVVASLLMGLTLVFFYAAVRPRFGPGPRTAVIAAIALWVASYVVTLIGYCLLGLFPTRLLALWAVIGLVELVLGATIGGWVYRESEAEA